MRQPAVVLLVRFRSNLSRDKVLRIAEERAPQYRALEGLTQKYYLETSEGGEYGGLYLWESPDALSEFARSELRAAIKDAYQVEGEPRVEVYQVMMPLRD
ncbi:MAG: YdhR family protein [Acidimicrobiia bacterium]|nr:YdhR family protein [Acidimicrobiia bacterium]